VVEQFCSLVMLAVLQCCGLEGARCTAGAPGVRTQTMHAVGHAGTLYIAESIETSIIHQCSEFGTYIAQEFPDTTCTTGLRFVVEIRPAEDGPRHSFRSESDEERNFTRPLEVSAESGLACTIRVVCL
jgi:hypothetical protein